MIVDTASAATSQGDRGLTSQHLSDAGGLRQFGACLDTLAPNGWSSCRHWHDCEDEFILILGGEATVIDDDGAHLLQPGDAACWQHGDPNGHHITNTGSVPLRYLIVGSRVARDICRYPDDARMQVNGDSRWKILAADGSSLREGPLPDHLLSLPPRWGRPHDPATPGRRIIRSGSVPAETGAGATEGLDVLGDYRAFPLSDAGGLTQFGAFTETLMPGARSSHRHWHAEEDEFLYVLDGTVTLHEDDGAHNLGPGGSACWPKGVANGHCLENRTTGPVTYFIAGTRLPEDAVHYPDIDLHYTRRNGLRTLSRKDGTPCPGWPKETTR